jgi:hypothetical protein
MAKLFVVTRPSALFQKYLILKSLAPGCVERIRKAIAKGEDDARGCKYE